MAATAFRKKYAHDILNQFKSGSSPAFPNITPDDVRNGLAERIDNPDHQNQSAASLCGPAAFFYMMLNWMPDAYVQYVIDLYTTGKASIGSVDVSPSDNCRSYRPPRDKIAPVDWVALASDSENTVLDYSSVNDTASGITRPPTIADWMNRSGCFTAVEFDSHYIRSRDPKDVKDFSTDLAINRFVCLFVNAQILSDATVRSNSHLADHWIVATQVNRLEMPDNKSAGKIQISAYSWGKINLIPTTGTLTLSQFCNNFYGSVSGAGIST